MRKVLTSVLTVFVLTAAIFTCCGQTNAFASLIQKSRLHDCCKKNLPQSHSDHQDCQCHHDISTAPSQADAARLVQDALTNPAFSVFTVVDLLALDHLAPVVSYNGPPDDRVSETPLYYQYSVLRL